VPGLLALVAVFAAIVLVPRAAASTLTFKSDATWTTYSADPGTSPNPGGGTSLGPAQVVCLTENTPPDCPDGATAWATGDGSPFWSADRTAIPGAQWIWAPGLTGESSPSDDQAYWFSRTFTIGGTPLQGTVHLSGDNETSVIVNGTPKGAGSDQFSMATLDITDALVSGSNVITMRGYNAIGCGAPCNYTANPAGSVFGGTITYRAPGEKDSTATAVTSSPSAPVWGEPVTLTATVTDTLASSVTPEGTVQFRVGGTDVGSPRPLADGVATLATSSLPVGASEVSAVYVPAEDFLGSEGAGTVTVGRAPTTTALGISPDPTVAGQSAEFTAIVDVPAPGAGKPTGTVQFSEFDGTPIGPPQPLGDDGRARIEASAGAGQYTVSATFSGDEHFLGSGNSANQQVDRARTTTTLTSDPNPVVGGQDVVWTASVRVEPPGDVAPTAGVMFTIDGYQFTEPIPVDEDGQVAILVTTPTEAHIARIGAVYVGDADTEPSGADLDQHVIDAPVPTIPPPVLPATATPRQRLSAMTASLHAGLRSRGLGALARTRQRFDAPGPGTLQQRVYTPSAPRSATGAQRRKPVLLATARRIVRAAGVTTLRLRLTAAGKRRARRAARTKLAVVTRFTPRSGAATTVVSRLTVKARRARASRIGGWRVTLPEPRPPARRGARSGHRVEPSRTT
jgi:hypothetical protein